MAVGQLSVFCSLASCSVRGGVSLEGRGEVEVVMKTQTLGRLVKVGNLHEKREIKEEIIKGFCCVH